MTWISGDSILDKTGRSWHGASAMQNLQKFTRNVVVVIQAIPEGKVTSYGRVAALAGNSRGARQVSRFLHSLSEKYDLPWHRVVNASGRISLPRGRGYEQQRALLEDEGVVFSISRTIDLTVFLWEPVTHPDGSLMLPQP